MRLPLLVLPLLLVACGQPAADEAPPVEPTVTRTAIDNHGFIGVTGAELNNVVRQAGADLVVVNFWASWCLPCREEMPSFIRLARESDAGDLQVRFVSVDDPTEYADARAFLDELQFVGDSYVYQGDQQTFINDVDPSWTGSLPATAVYNRAGERLTFWEGKVTHDELTSRLAPFRTPTS